MRASVQTVLPALFAFTALSLSAGSSFAAEWQPNVNYGGSTPPTMDLYVPDNADEAPGVVVSLHYCGGTSGNAQGWFKSLADQYGFIIIAPDVGPVDCWNAKPERSGEREAITKMVQYVIDEHSADPARVFAAGASSGACMTNALMAAYPDVFSGGSVLAGVPAGDWNKGNSCCGDNSTKSGEQWGTIVRNASPDFDGQRPRLQLWHGTSDTTLPYSPNMAEEVKQWSNVLGVTDADATSEENKPKSGWTRTSYTKDGVVLLEANIGQGQGHDLSGQNLWGDVVRFFGLDMDAAPVVGTGGTDGSGSSSGSGGALGAGGAIPGSGSGGVLEGGTGTGGSVIGAGTGGASFGVGGSAASSGGSGNDVTTSGEDVSSDDDSTGGCQTGGPTRPLGIVGIALLSALLGWTRFRRRAIGN